MVPATGDKEKELVLALRERTEEGQRACYEQYYCYLTAVCARYVPSDEDVKDLLQEIFIKIFTQIDRFSYRGPGSFRAWCHQVAVNESLMFLRSRKRRRMLSIERYDRQSDEEEVPDDPMVEDIPPGILLDLIRKLPERYRTVFNLYIFEDKSHREIAGLLHIKEDSSASNLHRAKALLAKWIEAYKKGKSHGG